jgi:hypothetical protein
MWTSKNSETCLASFVVHFLMLYLCESELITLTLLGGQKFTYIIRVLSNKSIQKRDPSFEVLMIKQRFRRFADKLIYQH